jgi:predicted SprT family Zn-dependent metalloprotease
MNNKIVRTEKGFKEFFNNAIRQFNEKYNSDIEEINFPVVFTTKSEMKGALGGYSYYMDKITKECIPYRFAFSKNIIQTVKEDNLNTILLHELGHYIATERFGSQPNGGHSEKWERICAMLGLEEHNISPTISLDDKEMNSKYTLYCPNCKSKLGHRDRMSKAMKDKFANGYYRCGKCGSENLEVIQHR